MGNNISNNIKKTIKDLLEISLKNTKHPRYDIGLEMIRNARKETNNKKYPISKTESTSENNIKSIKGMAKLGISDETIGSILALLYHPSLNYRNTSEKIKSLGKISFQGSSRGDIICRTQWNTKKNLEDSVGGVCQNLAVMYKHLFDEKIIGEKIKKETNLETKITIMGGQDRKHFNQGSQRHVFCELKIGDQIFIIDPSFGEINNLQQGGYKIISETRQETNLYNINSQQDYHNSIKLNTIETKDQVLTKKSTIRVNDTQLMFLGYFYNTDLFLNIGYGKNEETGKIYPLLSLWKNYDNQEEIPKNNQRLFAILTDQNDVLSIGEKLPQKIQQKVLETLIELKKIVPEKLPIQFR